MSKKNLSDKEMEFNSQPVKIESTDAISDNDCIPLHDAKTRDMPVSLIESVSIESETELKFHRISELEYNFHKFVNHYDQILLDIQSDSSLDEVSKIQKKIQNMETYLELMKEQNESFVNVMVELENESTKRVKQMERRLHTSAETTMDVALNLNEFDMTMQRLEQLKLDSLCVNTRIALKKIKTESNFLWDENLNLKHDLKELLQLIRHARTTGNWNLTFSTFCYLQPEEVFGSIETLSDVEKKEGALFNTTGHKLLASFADSDSIRFDKTKIYSDAFDAVTTPLYFDDSKFKKPARDSSMLQIQRIVQSEPNIFMFSGMLFVYKPCQLVKSSSLLLDGDVPYRRCISGDGKLYPYKQCMNTQNLNYSCESPQKISVGVQVAIKFESSESDKQKLEQLFEECGSRNLLELEGHLLNEIKLRSDAEKKNAEIELKMKEIMEEKTVLQNQKCALMIQLDNQSDSLENIKNDLQTAMQKNQSFLIQFERQSQVIKHLQEALVQSKRAYDTIKQKSSTS